MKQRLIKIFLFALPISASNLVNMLSSFIAMVFLAQISIKYVAAVSLSAALYYCFLTILTTSTYATSILISHEIGKTHDSHTSSIATVYSTGLLANLILIIPASVLLWHGDWLLTITGQDKLLSALTIPYFHYGALSLFPTLISTVNTQFFIGIGKPRISLFIAILRLITTVFFSYCLILGKFSMPKLGTGGITAAIALGQLFICIITFALLWLSPYFKPYHLFKHFLRTNKQMLMKFYRIGLPIGIQFGGELLAIAVITMMLGHLGVNALAATQIVSQFGMFLIMIMLGIVQALSVLTSASFGQRNFRLIRQDLFTSIVLLSSIYIAAGILVVVFYQPLLSLFFNIHDPSKADLLFLTLALMAIRWTNLWIDGLRNLFSATLRGVHLSAYPMQVGLACLWLISLPMSYIGGFIYPGHAIGLTIGFSGGFITASIILWLKIQNLTHQFINKNEQLAQQ